MTQTKQGKGIWAWCLFDFANSPFTTLVVTFIFAAYFTQSIAEDTVSGTASWSRGVAVTAILVAILSPFLGALADRGGWRKMMLGFFTGICIICTTGLFWVTPGQVFMALVLFVIANTAFEMGMVFYNAFLPDIAPPDKVGRISGYGWGLGYLGGLIALALALVLFVQADPPWFGFSKEHGEHIRATNLLVALWFAIFSLPLFFFVKTPATPPAKGPLLSGTIQGLKQTLKEIRQYKQMVRFLVARLVFNDGLVTLFAFGGVYAAGTFGFTIEEILIFGIVLNVLAGLGAFVFGFLDDRLGGKRTLQWSLYGLILAAAIAILAPNRTWFWVASIFVGLMSGPNQSASRSLMARFIPDGKESEFFGFFAFSGKATAFVGPAMLGLLTSLFNNQRAGISIVLALFVLGLFLLARVNEQEGIAAAQNQADQPS